MEMPTKLGQWTHNKTGDKYTVIMVGNKTATKKGWSPITVCYVDSSGAEWTRPLSEWLERYTKTK